MHRYSSFGGQAQYWSLRLSCSEACGILVPWPGIEPMSPALQGRFLTTKPPRKSHLKLTFRQKKKGRKWNRSVVSYSFQSHRLQPPRSSAHGILQARILECIVMPSSRGSSWPRDWTRVSHVAGRFFIVCAIRETLTFRRGLQITGVPCLFFFFPFIFISWRILTLQYCSGFCHTLTWISHGFTCYSLSFYS